MVLQTQFDCLLEPGAGHGTRCLQPAERAKAWRTSFRLSAEVASSRFFSSDDQSVIEAIVPQ